MKTLIWILFALLAISTGLYPLMYLFVPSDVGLLSTKEAAVLGSLIWQLSFYGHISFGGIALITGWSQFNSTLRMRKVLLHRVLGKVYIISVMISGICALVASTYGSGGPIAQFGFASLAVVWLYTTSQAYSKIRIGDIHKHKIFMIYSYAVCFAAVSLRIYLPLLQIGLGDFETAYQVVAWLCWVPNLIFARIFIWRYQEPRFS